MKFLFKLFHCAPNMLLFYEQSSFHAAASVVFQDSAHIWCGDIILYNPEIPKALVY